MLATTKMSEVFFFPDQTRYAKHPSRNCFSEIYEVLALLHLGRKPVSIYLAFKGVSTVKTKPTLFETALGRSMHVRPLPTKSITFAERKRREKLQYTSCLHSMSANRRGIRFSNRRRARQGGYPRETDWSRDL